MAKPRKNTPAATLIDQCSKISLLVNQIMHNCLHILYYCKTLYNIVTLILLNLYQDSQTEEKQKMPDEPVSLQLPPRRQTNKLPKKKETTKKSVPPRSKSVHKEPTLTTEPDTLRKQAPAHDREPKTQKPTVSYHKSNFFKKRRRDRKSEIVDPKLKTTLTWSVKNKCPVPKPNPTKPKPKYGEFLPQNVNFVP